MIYCEVSNNKIFHADRQNMLRVKGLKGETAKEGRQGQRGLPGKGKYAEVATKTIPKPATCTRHYAAGGLVSTIIRRTVAGDALTRLL
ncbi:hypothetical protein SS25_01410 [Enterobacter hormaechei subsp. hormaechei]|nr:hypothetical protein LI64_09530 [Enterobacter hormaechei subsp. hormaechei]EGK63436.1 L-aspartate oxidase [Enterobacter hormaechei ATCC 49162]EGQ5310277.1 hypothetical protein [Enterobacter hormaechei]EGQ5312872.1 hypothetical protein [Enterobacter hormaechei]EGQ5323078.1 hypothetical protein [Enterobacter hormaechei]